MARTRTPMSIEIHRSAIYILNYTPRKCRTLEKALSSYDYVSKKYTHNGFVYDEDNRILKIPSHVGINFILEKCASDDELITDIVDKSNNYVKSRKINKLKCSAEPRNLFQKEAVDFIIANNVADKYKSHRLLTLSTGFGKTVCAIMGALFLKMPTVIYSINLSKQWIDRLLTFTDGKLGKDIIHIKSWDDIDRLMNSKYSPSGTFFIMGLDAANAALKRDPDKLNKFYEKFGIGMQIFDEFHLSFLKILNVLVNTSVERVLYLSATPSRSHNQQNVLFKKLFTANIQSYGEKTHDINKYNIISVSYKTRPKIQDLSTIETRRGIHTINYFTYIFRDPEKIKIFVDIILFFTTKVLKKYPDKKIIIYIQNLNGIKLVKEILTKVYKKELPNVTVGDYSGNVDKKVRHLELEHSVILSTMANNTGLDLKDLVMVLNFIPFSSSQILTQTRGRLREDQSWYVDISDVGFEGIIRQRGIRLIHHKRNMRSLNFYEYDTQTRNITKTLR